MKTLREAKPGETVTVTKLNGTGAVKRRIMDMGITKGIPVYIRKAIRSRSPSAVTNSRCARMMLKWSRFLKASHYVQ